MRVFIATMTAATLLCSMQTASAAGDAATVQATIEKLDPTVKVEQTSASAANGLYRTTLDGASGYVTADGRYFIFGDMFDVKNRRNLSEDLRKQDRLQALKEIDDSSAIVFAPEKPRHTVTVFTDVDCPYCRKLHSEIAQYYEHGIAVRYVAFPRSGPGSEAWKTMAAVWCAKDRRDALTRAKKGEKLPLPASCEAKGIAQHYALGEKLGLSGTPMIVLEDGAVINGYMPAAVLAARLEGGAAEASASAGQ